MSRRGEQRGWGGWGGVALPNSNILTGKQQPKGSQNWHLGPQVVVCHPNTFRHSVLDVDLGFCPRFCVKPWTRKSVSAIARTLSTVKIMLEQRQHSLESDVQGWDTLQRTLHIHHGAPSSDLPMGPLPGSYMWNPMQPLNAGSRGSRKGTLLLSPQTTGPPCQACFPGWVSANIPRLSCRTLRELCEFSGSCNGLISFLKMLFFPLMPLFPVLFPVFRKSKAPKNCPCIKREELFKKWRRIKHRSSSGLRSQSREGVTFDLAAKHGPGSDSRIQFWT